MGLFKEETLNKIKRENQHIEKRTILIVDDEEHNLSTLKDALIDQYDVLTATDGQDALELLQREVNPERVHLIISDQRMPNMTGVEFLKNSIAIIPKTIRIILTGFTDVEAVMDSINQAQIYKFILKPFDRQDIHLTIKRGLELFDLEKKNLQLIEALDFLNSRLFSHIRGNLQRIAGSAEIFGLVNPAQFTSEQKSLLQQMGDSTNNLIHLLNKASELSYIYTGHYPIRKEPLDIIQIIQKSVDAFRQERATDNLTLNYHWDSGTDSNNDGGYYVEADNEFLSKAIREILENSFNYTEIPPTISLRTFTLKNRFCIQIQDQGIGLENEGGTDLMQPFVRGKRSEEFQPFGLGIGLANAKAYLEAQNGELSFVKVETGSIVQLSLMLPDFEPKDDYEFDAELRKILIYQENKDELKLYKEILEFDGHDTKATSTSQELLTAVERQPYDLIFLDATSMEKSLQPLIPEIRATAENGSTPIVVLSDDPNLKNKQIYLSKGAQEYLSKPLDYDQLITLIQQYT